MLRMEKKKWILNAALLIKSFNIGQLSTYYHLNFQKKRTYAECFTFVFFVFMIRDASSMRIY